MIKFYLLLVLNLFFLMGFAQRENDSVPSDDTATVLDIRFFDEGLNERYTGDEFNYDIKDGEAQNLLERFLRWLSNLLGDTFGFSIDPDTLKVLELVIYLLMGGLVIYFLVKFFIGEKLSSIFTKKATSIIDINLSEEHIENVDLDALIKLALEQKDYRLAVRYQYLRTLKDLSQKNIIEWHYEKTNTDYQREITIPRVQSLFKEVSYLYDYIWYGEQIIDEPKYVAARSRFVALTNLIPE
ncbi:MAG: hypothetical protein AAFO99_07360 [Bacteroidota bacterium]